MFGHTVCQGEDENFIKPNRKLKYANAVQLCGSAGLWNPLQDFNNTIAFSFLYREVYGMSKLWTGVKRFNESHTYFKDKFTAIKSLPLCAPIDTGRFKSAVLLTYEKEPQFGFYAVSQNSKWRINHTLPKRNHFQLEEPGVGTIQITGGINFYHYNLMPVSSTYQYHWNNVCEISKISFVSDIIIADISEVLYHFSDMVVIFRR